MNYPPKASSAENTICKHMTTLYNHKMQKFISPFVYLYDL